jgi:hypothetical protein
LHECYDNASKKCLAKRYFCCGQGPDRNGRQLIARKLTGGKLSRGFSAAGGKKPSSVGGELQNRPEFRDFLRF